MAETQHVIRRYLAHADTPDNAASELDWINSRTGILGESFGTASSHIQRSIDDGSMVVVREELISIKEEPI